MTQNQLLMMLTEIWKSCVLDYPDADHGEIFRHIEALQMLIFRLD
jgi:hypothetical protein